MVALASLAAAVSLAQPQPGAEREPPTCAETAAAMQERLEEPLDDVVVPASAPAWLRKLERQLDEPLTEGQHELLFAGAWAQATARCPEPFKRRLPVPEAVRACGCSGLDVDAIELLMRLEYGGWKRFPPRPPGPPRPPPAADDAWTARGTFRIAIGAAQGLTPGEERLGGAFDSTMGARIKAPSRWRLRPGFHVDAGYSHVTHFAAPATHLFTFGAGPTLVGGAAPDFGVGWIARLLAGTAGGDGMGVRNSLLVCAVDCVVTAELSWDHLWMDRGGQRDAVRLVVGIDFWIIYYIATNPVNPT